MMNILFFTTLAFAVGGILFDWLTSPRLKDGVFENNDIFRDTDGRFQKTKYLIFCAALLVAGVVAEFGVRGLGAAVFLAVAAFRAYIGLHNLRTKKAARANQIRHLTNIKAFAAEEDAETLTDEYLTGSLKFFFRPGLAYYLAFAWITSSAADQATARREIAARILKLIRSTTEANWFD